MVDVDQNENPRNTAIYRVTFDPCATNFTVRYQNIVEMVGSPARTEVDNVTDGNISQPFGGDSTVNLVVIQTENGVIFGVSSIILGQHLAVSFI